VSLWVAAAAEAGWSTSTKVTDAKENAIAIWTFEDGAQSWNYVALVHQVDADGRVTFAYFSKKDNDVRYFVKQGSDILRNGKGFFRGYIYPAKQKSP
jgi:hypothetical protein